MSLLVFVSVLLMVLASMSYGELKTYLTQALAQESWTRFMESWEGCSYSRAIGDIYKDTPKKKSEPWAVRDSNKKVSDSREKSDGSSRINFRILIGKGDPAVYEQFHSVLKNLLMHLYKDVDFFKKAQIERPNFLDEIFEKLKEFSDNKSLKKADSLANLKFGDRELEDLFYLILRDTPNDEKEACKGFSLLDFLGDGNKFKIRIFLAPQEILFAVFGSQEVVDEVVNERDRLYKEIKDAKEAEAASLATQQFQEKFAPLSPYREILDFKVTKTDPKKYQ